MFLQHFVYGDLKEAIDLHQPEGYEDGSTRVFNLIKSLYELKKYSRCWNECIERFLISLEFQVTEENTCIFIREKNVNKWILDVDNALVAAIDREDLAKF